MKKLFIALLFISSVSFAQTDTIPIILPGTGGSGGGGSLSPIPNRTYLGNISGTTALPDTLAYSVFNVLDFGLKNDSATDNTAAFKALLAQVPDNATIKFPGGKGYIFSDSIVITRGLNIIGDGQEPYDWYAVANTPKKGGSTLFFTDPAKNFLILKNNAANKSPTYNISNIGIANTNVTATASVGLRIDSSLSRTTMRDVSIRGFYVDFKNRGIWTTVDNCAFLDPVAWCVITDNPIHQDFGGANFTNSKFMSGKRTGNTSSGLWFKGGGLFKLMNCDFNAEANFSATTQFVKCFYADYSDGETTEVMVSENSFDNYNKRAIEMVNLSGATTSGTIQIMNNIASYNTDSTISPIYISGFNFVHLAGNTSRGRTTSHPFVKVNAVTSVNIIPGNFSGYAVYDSIVGSTNVRRGIQSKDGTVTLDGFSMPTYTSYYYPFRIGEAVIQPVTSGTTLFNHNSFFNGTTNVSISAGYGAGFQPFNGQLLLYGMNTVSAGATQTKVVGLKTDYFGNVAIGGNTSSTLSTYTGAKMLVNGSTGDANISGKIYVGDITTAAHSGVQTNSFATGYAAKTSTYTTVATDHTINCTSGTFTVTLSTPVGATGRIYTIKNSGAGVITVATSGQLIDGASTYSLPTQYKYVSVQSDGANWMVIGNN